MSPTLEEQIQRLKSTIAQMEAQRDSLGDEFVDHALLPFQQKLSELIDLLQAGEAGLPWELPSEWLHPSRKRCRLRFHRP